MTHRSENLWPGVSKLAGMHSTGEKKKKKGLMEAIVYCGCVRRKEIGKQSSQIPNLQVHELPSALLLFWSQKMYLMTNHIYRKVWQQTSKLILSLVAVILRIVSLATKNWAHLLFDRLCFLSIPLLILLALGALYTLHLPVMKWGESIGSFWEPRIIQLFFLRD